MAFKVISLRNGQSINDKRLNKSEYTIINNKDSTIIDLERRGLIMCMPYNTTDNKPTIINPIIQDNKVNESPRKRRNKNNEENNINEGDENNA